MAEWSKAPDSSSGPLTRAWVQIPLQTKTILFIKIYKSLGPVWLCGCNSYFYILNNFTHIFLLTRNYVPIVSVLKVVFFSFFSPSHVLLSLCLLTCHFASYFVLNGYSVSRDNLYKAKQK